MLRGITCMLKGIPKFCAKNSTVICTIGASAGVIGTAILSFKAGVKTGRALQDMETNYSVEPVEFTKKEKIKVAFDSSKGTIIGATTTAVLTIGIIIASGVIDIRRQKALSTALAISSEAARTYKDKVIETIGEKKEGEIRSKIAEDEFKKDPPDESVIFNTGTGSTLFKDRISGRYFRAGVDWIRKQQNEANSWFLAGEDFISVNEWYGLIGIESLPDLDELGWNVDETIKFDLDACMGPNDEPGILINYDISPRHMYHRYH